MCVWEQERQRDYCVWLCESRCRHLLESWSPARGCYNMQGCHTRTNSTVIFKLCVHVKTTAGQTLLFILMTPPQSQMQPDINTWPSAKHTVPHQCLCLCQPIARRAMINPAILLHSPHTHTVCSKYRQKGACRNVCFHWINGDDDVALEGISSPDDSFLAWSQRRLIYNQKDSLSRAPTSFPLLAVTYLTKYQRTFKRWRI